MADLDTLRPEVREAIHDIAIAASLLPEYQKSVGTIHAELLRLAALEHAWQQWIKDGMRVEFLPPELPK